MVPVWLLATLVADGASVGALLRQGALDALCGEQSEQSATLLVTLELNVEVIRDSTDPVAHSGKLCQVKATLRCKGRIGKQAEIGGGEIVDQPLPALQMVLHAHKRSVSQLQKRGLDLAVCLAAVERKRVG